jgi:hypothetical protein
LDAEPSSHDQVTPAKPSVIATVFECNSADQRVFSDRPCSEHAQVREVIAPNGMHATRAVPSRSAIDRSVPEQPGPGAGGAGPIAYSKESVCASIDDQIDRINARMRQPYTAPEGEWYRERLRSLDNERWDAKCRIK